MKKFTEFANDPIELVAVTNETLTAREFLELRVARPNEIKRAQFVAPKIGSKGFGSFSVEYRTPKLVHK